MAVDEMWCVEIEFKRVQGYLFGVPRLPVMVGANALLGETLRGRCRDGGGRLEFDLEVASLPLLAAGCNAQWPRGCDAADNWPIRGDEDPLVQGIWQDDVARVAKDTGVLSRDGGHFAAVFPAEEAAKSFLARAMELTGDRLPGVRVQARLKRISRGEAGWMAAEVGDGVGGSRRETVLDLPQAEVCEYSGNEPASEEIQVGAEKVCISRSVYQKYEAGRRFDAGKTNDVLGILRPSLLSVLGFSTQDASDRPFPAEFAEISVQGYLAVVYVDGNSVGSRFDAYRRSFPEDFFARWAKGEQFFHALRVGMRIATCRAIQRVFANLRTGSGAKRVPLRLLMLGGDDLLLVCGAPWGLPFVVELARELQETTKDLPDGQGPLTVGAGVAIVHDKFPFHRAHDLAEQLAQSAKRLKSALPPGHGNVVDWLLVTESWHGDVGETRRRDLLVEDLILSGRPYPVLKMEDVGEGTLEQMLQDAKDLREATQGGRFARSQLHALAAALPEGRYSAEFAAGALEDNTRNALRSRSYLSEEGNPWIAMPDGRQLTRVLDLMELYELEMLTEEAISAGEVVRPTGVGVKSP